MTPAELKSARRQLGLSTAGLAHVLRVTSRSIRRWEDGTRDIPGPAIVVIELMLDSCIVCQLLGIPADSATCRLRR